MNISLRMLDNDSPMGWCRTNTYKIQTATKISNKTIHKIR